MHAGVDRISNGSTGLLQTPLPGRFIVASKRHLCRLRSLFDPWFSLHSLHFLLVHEVYKVSCYFHGGFHTLSAWCVDFTYLCLKDCSKNYFSCGNGYCISKDQVCDGFDSCGDCSDECSCSEPLHEVDHLLGLYNSKNKRCRIGWTESCGKDEH